MLGLYGVNLHGDAQDANPLRTVAGAVAAAGAEDFTELLRVDSELVQHALALAAGLPRTRVVTGSVRSENRELARIPGADPGIARRGAGVHDVETVAGRASEGAGAAAHAGESVFLPEWVLEVLGDERADGLWIEFLFRSRGCPDGLAGFLRLATEQGPAFFRHTVNFVVVFADVEQHDVGAAFRHRTEPNRGAKAGFVGNVAGQCDHGSGCPAAIVELVHKIPVEDLVQDRQRGRIARPGGDHDLLGKRSIILDQFDAVALNAISV